MLFNNPKKGNPLCIHIIFLWIHSSTQNLSLSFLIYLSLIFLLKFSPLISLLWIMGTLCIIFTPLLLNVYGCFTVDAIVVMAMMVIMVIIFMMVVMVVILWNSLHDWYNMYRDLWKYIFDGGSQARAKMVSNHNPKR